MTTHKIDFWGYKLKVTGTFYNGSMGTREDPPTYDEFEIEKITCKRLDLTDLFINVYEAPNKKNPLLTSSIINLIEEKIINEYYL